jgi:hypothetical protein
MSSQWSRKTHMEIPMTQFTLFLAAGALSLACCSHVSGADVAGSGTRSSATRTVETFHSVQASGAFTLEVRSGSTAPSVVVEGDDNIVPLFVSDVSDGTLHLHLPSGSFDLKTPLFVRVEVPKLQRVEASGAIDTSVEAIAGKSFEAELSGACKLRASGTVDEFRVFGSGATRVDAFDLEGQDVRLSLSGASRGNVNAARALTVDVSGASTVRYRGTPSVESSASGASSIAPE